MRPFVAPATVTLPASFGHAAAVCWIGSLSPLGHAYFDAGSAGHATQFWELSERQFRRSERSGFRTTAHERGALPATLEPLLLLFGCELV